MDEARDLSLNCPRCGNPLTWLPHYGQWYCVSDRLLFPGTRPQPVTQPFAPAMVAGVPAVLVQPRPVGVPSRSWFTAGAVGHFMAVAASIAFGVSAFGFFGYGGLSLLHLALVAFLFVSLLLSLFGFFGMRRNYGSQMGLATFGYGLAAVLFLLVGQVVAQLTVSYGWWGYAMSLLGIILIITSWVLLGVLYILAGVTYIVARHFLGNAGLALAAGVVLIVGGSLISSVILAVYGGFFVVVPGLIMGGIVLLKAPVPPAPSPAVRAVIA